MVLVLHRYFRLWERLFSPLYRVTAVIMGAAATAAGIGAGTRSNWLLHLPLALATWALLAKVEGDARDRNLELGQRGYPFGGGAAGVREPRRPAPAGGGASRQLREKRR